MKIVVTTPTGHIGSRLANILIDRNSEVTVIARHPEKVKHLTDRGAKVIAGEHGNSTVLEQALSGADALFWLTPSNITSHDPLGDARRLADAAAGVIRKHPDLHVVQLSSAGAFLPSGTGPIAGLHYTEEKFRTAGKNITALRPNEFMENVFFYLHSIIADGAIYVSVSGSLKAPLIATADIAAIAADFLLNPRPGHHIIDIVGPEELTFNDLAQITGEAIGKPVRLVTIPGDKLKVALTQAGLSSEMAALFVEMEAAAPNIMNKFYGEEKRTGKITYRQFAREVFLPAYKRAIESAA
jgi:uncharacterized protein YbjT (DUF2867 family)